MDNEFEIAGSADDEEWVTIGNYQIKVFKSRDFSVGGLSLSYRERQLLRELSLGKPLKLICEEMGIAVNTANTFKSRIFSKLGVSNQAAASALAAAYITGAKLRIKP